MEAAVVTRRIIKHVSVEAERRAPRDWVVRFRGVPLPGDDYLGMMRGLLLAAGVTSPELRWEQTGPCPPQRLLPHAQGPHTRPQRSTPRGAPHAREAALGSGAMSLALAVAALVASVLLLLQFKGRLLPIIALVASGVEVLMALGVLRLDLRGLPLGLVLAGALAVSGVMMYLRAGPKTVVASTTCVALVGVVQVLVALRLVH